MRDASNDAKEVQRPLCRIDSRGRALGEHEMKLETATSLLQACSLENKEQKIAGGTGVPATFALHRTYLAWRISAWRILASLCVRLMCVRMVVVVVVVCVVVVVVCVGGGIVQRLFVFMSDQYGVERTSK